MPFSPSFTVSQNPTNPGYIVLTDTSTDTDASIVSRRITIKDSEGNYIVTSGTTTNYMVWGLGTNPISLNVLTQDTAANVKVEWLYAGNVVQYTTNANYCFTQYNKQFLYYLIQLQSLNYNIIQDTNYWGNVGIFWTNITGAINSVEIGNDIVAAQVCLNRATNMAANQSKYF
jgi:hypothetical protein